jgi:threonine dehydratase
MVHPYDDLELLAGQATVGAEMLAAPPDLQCPCVAVGRGGLISGFAVPARLGRFQHRDRRSADRHDILRQRDAGRGLCRQFPGALTSEIVRGLVNDIVRVGEGDIGHEIVPLLEMEKAMFDAAVVARLAASRRYRQRFQGASGDPMRRQHRAAHRDRGMVRAGRLARIRVAIRDVPGRWPAPQQLSARPGRISRRSPPAEFEDGNRRNAGPVKIEHVRKALQAACRLVVLTP